MEFIERYASYVPVVVGLTTVYLVAISYYRVFLHPLAKVPGPWLAATSHLLEFYYDVVKDGQYPVKIKEWHGKYGMRI